MSRRVNLASRHNMSRTYFHFFHHSSLNFIVNGHYLNLVDLAMLFDVTDK